MNIIILIIRLYIYLWLIIYWYDQLFKKLIQYSQHIVFINLNTSFWILISHLVSYCHSIFFHIFSLSLLNLILYLLNTSIISVMFQLRFIFLLISLTIKFNNLILYSIFYIFLIQSISRIFFIIIALTISFLNLIQLIIIIIISMKYCFN